MKANVGSADKIVRYLLALGLAALMFFGVVEQGSALFWAAGALAVIFAGTAMINWCPIWAALGVNTRKSSE